MLIQNLQITLRNIFRNKLTALINIFGLSISLACCVLIILFIRYELSYDRFSVNAHRIYRFTFSIKRSNGYQAHFARCAEPWVKFFPEDFPEIEKMVTFSPYKNITLKINDEKFSLKNSFYTDSTFFNVFNIKLLQGDPARVLKDPNTAVISSSLAAKYFKNTDPVGQTIINTGQYEGNKWISRSFTITGVFKDIPANSHFHSDLFLSKASIKPNDDYVWKYVYIMMKTNANPDDFIMKFPDFLKKHGLEEKDIRDVIPDLQCITDIHLKSDKDREIEQNGNLSIIYITGLIGIIILVISWINYLNLTIARVFSHGKSIILYKIYGNIRSIFTQYFIEALFINLISLILAIILIGIFFPIIRAITGNVFNDNALQFIPEIIIWLSVLFAGSLLIGCIPVAIFAIKLKSSGSLLKPAIAGTNKTSSVFRKSLVVFQFTLTIILIICALVINMQSKYIIDHQAGAKQDSVLVIKLFNQDILSRYDLLKAELLKSPYIKEASATFEEPYAQTMDAMGFETDGIKEENKDKVLWVYSADDNFFKFNNIPIIAGSDFPVYNGNLKKDYYILNETAVRDLGWTPEEAVGKPFKLKFPESDTIFYGGNIVGVAKDFNLNTLHHGIKPFVFFQKEIWFWVMLIKVDTEHRTQAMDFIKQKWEMISPDYPLTYEYNSDVFFAAYKKEIIQSRLTWFFSVIAIIISCLGLFAISSIVILRRTKEIGLRKVNGASIVEIMRMLSLEFTRGVLIAFLIAVPIAYYIMNKWLQNFVYKTDLSWWIFLVAGLTAFAVALLTVSWQCWYAAKRNPVEALRYE